MKVPVLQFYIMGTFREEGGHWWHVHDLRVRYADTDRMDMVYHGTYAAYLEAARVEMLRDAGWVYAEMESDGILLPVVQLNMTYRRPGRYDAVLEVWSHVTAPPTSKLSLVCEVRSQGELLVRGEVTLVFVDRATGKPRRAPQGFTEALVRHHLIR